MTGDDLSATGPRNERMKRWWQERGYRFEGDPGEPLGVEEYVQACMITAMEDEVDEVVRREVLGGTGGEMVGILDWPGVERVAPPRSPSVFETRREQAALPVLGSLSSWVTPSD